MKKRQVIGLVLAWALLGMSTAVAAPPEKPKERQVTPPAATRPAGELLKEILRKLSIVTGTNPFGINDVTPPDQPPTDCVDPNGNPVACVSSHTPVPG